MFVGLVFASLYYAFADAVAAANNGQWQSGEPIPIARIVGAYIFAGILGGAVVRRMLLDSEGPLRRVRVAGVLAFIIIGSLTTSLVGWPWRWGVVEWTAKLIAAGATACILFVRWSPRTEPELYRQRLNQDVPHPRSGTVHPGTKHLQSTKAAPVDSVGIFPPGCLLGNEDFEINRALRSPFWKQ